MTDQLVNKGEKKDEFFLLTALISRRLVYPVALMFCKLGVSANAVTIMGGVLWVLSSSVLLIAGWLLSQDYILFGYVLLLLSLLMVNLGYILDVADGSIARIKGTSSSGGHFLDYVFHLLFHPMYFCSIGIFLYLITGWVFYLVIGVLAICSGWGVSFCAKEHVLCEQIAKNAFEPSKLTKDERYQIYIDSMATRQSVKKKTGLKVYITLIKEILLFPGQYTFISVVIFADLFLIRYFGSGFILLQVAFTSIALVTISCVPLRIKREYQTLQKYDQIRRKQS